MTPEQIATLPDDLLIVARLHKGTSAELFRRAADRICDLEVEAFKLRAELVQLREETDQ